jgi:arylsulfatase
MNKAFLLAALVAAVFLGILLTPVFTGDIARSEDYSCPGCNVLLITADTVRADHLSSYGYFRETTPNIDRLASQGLLFEQAYIQIPFTPPSHWSIMTGLYPFRHGMYLPTDSSDLETLAVILGNSNYTTAAFTSSYMVGNLDNGFDVFEKPGFESEKKYVRAGKVMDSATSWLEDMSDEPFFIWLHFFDAHSPYQPPDEFDTYDYSSAPEYSGDRYSLTGVDNFNPIRHDIGKYDGEIGYVDSQVGRAVSLLEELGLSDDTLIVLVSDHGECFGEHDFSDFGYEMSGPCLFHDKTLYQEEVHVPLIIMNPRAVHSKGRRIPEIVESVDILPTVLDILDIPFSQNLDGTSLGPLIEGNTSGFDKAFFQIRPGETGTFAYGLLTPEWKFVRTGLSPDKDGDILVSGMLFDREVDARESSNAAEENPAVSTTMEDNLLFVLASLGEEKIYIDTKTEDILRMFGYLD